MAENKELNTLSFSRRSINRRIATIKHRGLTPSTQKSIADAYSNLIYDKDGAKAGYIKSYTEVKKYEESKRQKFDDFTPYTKEDYENDLRSLVRKSGLQTDYQSTLDYVYETGKNNISLISDAYFESQGLDRDDFEDMIESLSKTQFAEFLKEVAPAAHQAEKEGYGSGGMFSYIASQWIDRHLGTEYTIRHPLHLRGLDDDSEDKSIRHIEDREDDYTTNQYENSRLIDIRPIK